MSAVTINKVEDFVPQVKELLTTMGVQIQPDTPNGKPDFNGVKHSEFYADTLLNDPSLTTAYEEMMPSIVTKVRRLQAVAKGRVQASFRGSASQVKVENEKYHTWILMSLFTDRGEQL